MVNREKVSWFNHLKEEHEADIEEFYFKLSLLKRSPLTIIGLIIVITFMLTAILANYLILDPGSIIGITTPEDRLQPPSSSHPFGTDDLGRDLYSRVVYGSRISLVIGILTVTLTMTIGISLGLCAGYFGGNLDEIIMRVTDLFLSLPSLVLAILIASALGAGLFNMMIALAITRWPRYARLVRSMTLKVKEEKFIEAAKMVGASSKRIILKHILPSCISPITVQASFDIGGTILTAAALGFIGVGAIPPTPEWGLIISCGRLYIPNWWWYATFPGLAIIITVSGFNLLGDGLRDILDPRLRR